MTMILLIAAAVVLACIAAGKLAQRFGVPFLLLFILLGMLFGSDGLFKISFDDFHFAENICSAALIVIMFYGGFGTNWKTARPVASKAIWLSTLGVVLTAAFTGLFCHFVLGAPPVESFLIGSVISSTDAASVFAILRSHKLHLRDGAASLLEVESGSNDPMSYMLTITALGLMGGGGIGSVAYLIFSQVTFGVLVGVGFALVVLFLLKYVDLSSNGFDTLFVLAAAVAIYATATAIGGNGYLAVYLAGIIMGNSRISNKGALVHFFDGVTGLAQIVIFFLLGLLAFPSQMLRVLPISLMITLFLTFVARPAAVFAILTPARCSWRQQLVVSWAGLRGAASIVFAIMATVSGAVMENDLFHIVFCVSLFSVAFQGTLLPMLARKLDFVDKSQNIFKTFTDYCEDAEMQLIRMDINKEHIWAGRAIRDLKLVHNTLIVLIKRNGSALIPKGDTVIQVGDVLVMNSAVYKGDDDMQLREVKITSGHKWLNQQIRDITFPKNSLIIMIRRIDGYTVIPKGKTHIKKGDTMIMGYMD